MRIGIDLRPLQGETRYRGIGKTQEFLLSALARLPEQSQHNFTFYIDAKIEKPTITSLFPKAQLQEVKSLALGRKRYFRSFLPTFLAPRPDPNDIDVFLQFDGALGIPKRVPTVVIFYDLIPLLFRDIEKASSGDVSFVRHFKNNLASYLYWKKYLRFLGSFQKAKHLLSISENSKKDLLRFFPDISSNDITVVPLGVDRAFFAKPRKPSRKVRELASKPYLLYVGGIDTRKNVTQLIKTFYALKPHYPDLRLVVVGKEFALESQLGDRGWFTELRKNEDYAKDVHSPGFVTENDLLYLYREAECFLFPSLYEGFGLPILEAMATGCPVVAYDLSSIPEVSGKACTLVSQEEEFTAAVNAILSDRDLREKLVQKGRKHAAQFTWETTAKEVLTKVIENGNKT